MNAERIATRAVEHGRCRARRTAVAPMLVATLFLASAIPIGAGAQEYGASSGQHLSALTLANFFSEGWTQPWAKRERADGTPDMALLKVTTNFLERELRLDYARTSEVQTSTKYKTFDNLNGLIAYGLDRRVMLEVISNYQWNPRIRPGQGAGGA